MKENVNLSPELKKIADWAFTVTKYVCFIFIGWPLYGLGLFISNGDHELLLNSVTTNGTVVEVNKEQWITNRRTQTAYVPVVEFRVTGTDKNYRFKDNYGSNRSIPSVEVLYVEDKPDVAIINKGPFRNWLGQIIRIAVLLAAILGLKQLKARREQLAR